MTTGRAILPCRASWVFRPLPVMQRTVEPSRSIRPCSISFWATASGDAAGGLGPDPLGLGQELHAVDDRVVVDVLAPAAGLADQLRGEVAVGRVADGQALGDRVRVADRLDLQGVGLDRVRDRVAAGRLGAEHPGRDRAVDQAERLELLERLVDLADQAAAGHRRDDVVGEPPAEVLGDLEAHRLRPLGVERPEVDVDEPPAEPEGDLRAEPVDVVVVALDGDHLGAVDRRRRGPCPARGRRGSGRRPPARRRRRWPRRCRRGCPSRRSRRSGSRARPPSRARRRPPGP